MYMRAKQPIFRLSLLLGLLLTVCWCCRFCVFAQTAAEVRESTLRLHIRADSDEERDQQLKLLVRDAILEQSGDLFAQSGGKQQALTAARRSLPRIEQIAQDTLRKNGCTKPVKAKVVRMYFDTTDYERFTLPAGEYDALRVEIGSGAGHNWFCVLYPGLCLTAAQGEELYPEPAQQKLVTAAPEIRFAALEWLQKLLGRNK